MTDVDVHPELFARLHHLEQIHWNDDRLAVRVAHSHNGLVDVINALMAVLEPSLRQIDALAEQVAAITELLELDDPYPEIVDTPDIATYQEPT